MTRRKKIAKRERAPASVPQRKEVDIDPITADMRPADAARFRDAWQRHEMRASPIRADLSNEGGRKWAVKFPGSDEVSAAAQVRMLDALGTASHAFADGVLAQLMTIWAADGGITSKRYNAALAILESAQPQNEIEAMLVAQMIAANDAALHCTSIVYKADWIPHMEMGANLATKFMRTFTAQAEALAKLRRGGEQVVKYVHVHEGGQAVVADTINQTGGRPNLGTVEQPYGARATEKRAALSCPDPERDGVPIPVHGQRPMSYSRRQEPGSAEGQS